MKQHLTGYSLIHDMQLDGRHALSEFHTHAFDLFSKAVLYPSFPCVGAKQVLHQNAVAFVAAPMPMTHNEAGEYLCRCLYRWSEDIDYPQYQVNSAMKFITMIIVFPEMNFVDETEAEELLWQLLGRVHEHDRMHYDWTAESTRCVYDDRFSMSIGGYAHFIPFFSPVASTPTLRWYSIHILCLRNYDNPDVLKIFGKSSVAVQNTYKKGGIIPSWQTMDYLIILKRHSMHSHSTLVSTLAYVHLQVNHGRE